MQRLLLYILICVPSIFSAQFSPEISLVLGGNSLDHAMDIAVSPDSSFIFLGARTFSTDGDIPLNHGGSDFWILKRDLDGSSIWNKTFGGFSNDDLAVVMPHTDGGTLAFGTTRNEHGDFGDLHGLAGAWLIRINSSGVLTRGNIFGGDISENGIDAIRHSNGSVTMAIEASSPELDSQENNGVFDVWIVQADPLFNKRWSKLLGGPRQDTPAAIATDPAGNIYVAATSQSNLPGLDPNFGQSDVWIFKLDPLGEMLWQKNFGGAGIDVANDIVLDAFGNVYVMAESESDDSDFPSNRGFNDLWMIKLNGQTGQPLLFKQYGGEGNDVNANMTWLGNDHLVISATSNSDSFDLSGNKGFNDVWVFMVNTSGVIQQEMNYGGSLNDFEGDIITIDSVLYLFNSTFSSDKNVPVNPTTQQDVWLFTLNTNPEPCSDQFVCEQDSTFSNELFPPANEALICVAGCTAGLEIGPDFIQGGCPDFIYGTAYFKLITDTTADLLTLSVVSDEFNEPHIALLRSHGCTAFTQVACATGSEGRVLLQYITVSPLTTYIIAVSDGAGNAGTFELCATSVDVEFCNQKDTLYVNNTSLGSPLSGPFLPGERVQICYELQDWNKIDCNGFQGLIPTFGPGWDQNGFDVFGMPHDVDTLLMPEVNGFWDWYKVGDVHYNVNNPISGYGGGQGMPPGWFFTNLGDPPPNNNPDQTTGDIDDCLPTMDHWKVCFTLPVVEECEENMDLSISMRTFSDGELGVRTSLACAYDQEETLTIGMVCCINPTVQDVPETTICSGDTIILFPETNIIPPVTYSWIADPDVGITGATSGNELNRFSQILTNNTTGVLKVNYILWAEGINCEADQIIFQVKVNPLPSSRITITGPNIVCNGSTVTLNFESTGTPPYAIEVTRDNVFFANVLSESPNLSIQIDPQLSGRFRISNVRDAFCDGEGLGFVNIIVKPDGQNSIDTTICENQSVTVGGESFDEAGLYQVVLNDGAENNCDSVITLNLNVTQSLTQTINDELCTGDTLFVLGIPYTESTNEIIEFTGPLGCPDYINLNLIVRDTFVEEFSQTICGGDTLDFAGVDVFETGTYAHVEELRPGCFAQTNLHLTVLPAIRINGFSIEVDHGNDDGAILLEITGGNAPLTYLWSTGATTESLFNLMHGAYSLTVTDVDGCSETFHFIVPMATAIKNNEITYFNIWPTLLSAQENLILTNDQSAVFKIFNISWIDTKGTLTGNSNFEEVGPSTISVAVPALLTPGLYFLRIESKDGLLSWHKVVIH